MSRFDLLPNRRSGAASLGSDPLSMMASAVELGMQSKKKQLKKKVEKKIKIPDHGEGLFV